MKRIKFTSTERYESDGRNEGPLFKEGSVHEFEDDFADRWLRRGVAVEVSTRAKATEEAGAKQSAAPKIVGVSLDRLLEIAKAENVTVPADAKFKDVQAAIQSARDKAKG